jgi:hypothetical protein
MAKIVKVNITRELLPGGRIRNTYPPEYDSTKIKILAYEDLNNVSKTFCIGVVSDVDAVNFLKSNSITELTQLEAETLGNQYRPQVNMFTDFHKVAEICLKTINKEELTQAEKDALDPTKEELGYNKSTSFTTLLTEAKDFMDGK